VNEIEFQQRKMPSRRLCVQQCGKCMWKTTREKFLFFYHQPRGVKREYLKILENFRDDAIYEIISIRL
jgi:hypothetical protein